MINKGYVSKDIGFEKFKIGKIDFRAILPHNVEITKILEETEYNTQFVAAYLQYHIDQWKEAYPEITNDIGVLATLYNMSEQQPHSNPKPSDFGEKAKNNFEYIKSLLKP